MSDTKLWMLHIQGPDDVVAAPSKDEAEKVASAFNKVHGDWLAKQRAATAAAGGDPDNWPTVTGRRRRVGWLGSCAREKRDEVLARVRGIPEPRRRGMSLEMWMSPLTHRIYVGKSKNGVATSKQDVTAQCINGAIAHLLAIGETEIIVNLDEGRYRVRVTPEAA